MLQRSVDFDSTVVLEVRRSHILKDALRGSKAEIHHYKASEGDSDVSVIVYKEYD